MISPFIKGVTHVDNRYYVGYNLNSRLSIHNESISSRESDSGPRVPFGMLKISRDYPCSYNAKRKIDWRCCLMSLIVNSLSFVSLSIGIIWLHNLTFDSLMDSREYGILIDSMDAFTIDCDTHDYVSSRLEFKVLRDISENINGNVIGMSHQVGSVNSVDLIPLKDKTGE